ncbi:hypothetical protein P171DRAFT_526387 [Karstenula rhodostoma CBS 690.94]|uniref:RRM domain-containing protein n=1 Tax=Karstenula rhodostoma CBS 690.94 TaxID=1392251 RepID=A0A9P4P6H2_9PLEO|nr:hypothetical protein P171DRAFT_526387 [Karstenula rhodostoma CBS 690.94]
MPRGEKVALGEISAPEDRVIRVNNLHWDATNANITRFFRGYGLVDWKRSVNVKSGKSTVAYVLLSTLENVVRAIEELDVKVLLGRQVRIMRAKGGFQLTPSGLLNLEKPGHAVTVDKHLRSPALAKESAMDPESQVMSFPPLTGTSQAQAARGASLRRSRIPPPALIESDEHRSMKMFQSRRSRFQPGPQGPEHRVLLISKLHPDANRNAVELFFQGFRVVDYKRKYNDRIGRYNSTAFVLFESVEERDRARYMKQGHKILGREVSLDIATRGIRVGNNGFLLDNTSEIASPPRLPLAYGAERLGNDFPSPSATYPSSDPRSETDRIAYHPQKWVQPDISTNNLEQTTNIVQQATPPAQISSHYLAPNHHHEADGGQPIPPYDMLSEVLLPTNIQRTPRRGLRPWNLAGNNSEDKRYNVVTETEWYEF